MYRIEGILNNVEVNQKLGLANDISIPHYANLQLKCTS